MSLRNPRSATRAWWKDGASHPAHVVTLVEQPDGQHVVIIASANLGAAIGYWPTGFYSGDVPSTHSLVYVKERFFGSPRAFPEAQSEQLRIWNLLYLAALEEMGAPRA